MNGLSLMSTESLVNQIIESVLHNDKAMELESSEESIRSVEEETTTIGRQELTEQALESERDIMDAIENLNIELDDEEIYEYCL